MRFSLVFGKLKCHDSSMEKEPLKFDFVLAPSLYKLTCLSTSYLPVHSKFRQTNVTCPGIIIKCTFIPDPRDTDLGHYTTPTWKRMEPCILSLLHITREIDAGYFEIRPVHDSKNIEA